MAGSAKDTFETALLQLIFNNTNLANIGDGTGLRGSSTAGSFWVALYTAAPSDSAQGTEVTAGGYTGYARVAVARSAGGWTISGNNCSNAALVTFPICTGNSCTATHFTINTSSTLNANDAIFWADCSSPLNISNGVTPEFAIGDLDVNED